MKHFLALLFLVTNFLALHGANNDLDKSKHTVQDTIVSLFPAPAQSGVYPDADVEIVFSVGLDEKQVKPNVMRLRQIDGKKLNVKGTVSYLANEKRLRFVPAGFLEPGMYELDVMAVNATKEFQQRQIKNITYRFSVANVHPLSLKVKPSPIEVKEGTSVDLKTSIVYDDSSERIVKENVVYTSADTSILNIETNATATALKEGTTMVTSTYKGLISPTADAIVYLEIDGYRLPPEPDRAVNNSTLLGIDSNNNGVRDDVERWIYMTYEKPIERAVFMQSARAYQIVIQEPEKALETMHLLDDVSDCRSYWRMSEEEAISKGEPFWLEEYRDYPKEIYPIQFNTGERFIAHEKYNQTLSGGTYSSSNLEDWKSKCDFNTSTFIKVP